MIGNDADQNRAPGFADRLECPVRVVRGLRPAGGVRVTTRTRTKLTVAEAEIETVAVEQIDWKRRWEQKVSDEIENKAKYSAKLADAQLDLDKARGQIKDLEAQVRKLTPAQEKLDKLAKDARDADAKWAETVAGLRTEITALRTERGRGQRQVMEDVIEWIQAKADKLPEPIREPEIEFDPPTEAVFT